MASKCNMGNCSEIKMSTWLVAAMGMVYTVVALDQFIKGGVGTGIMFLGYAIGNIGLVLQVK